MQTRNHKLNHRIVLTRANTSALEINFVIYEIQSKKSKGSPTNKPASVESEMGASAKMTTGTGYQITSIMLCKWAFNSKIANGQFLAT